jgi:hypothetical protein
MQMNHVSQVVDLIRSGLNPGKPRGSHGLTLVPLFGGSPPKEYLIAEEAFEADLLSITEVEGGSVPEVAAVNSAEVPVLLLDGEHIEGAMQNRVLNSTALIAARHKTILPVACVEHGRWHYEAGDHFAPSDDIAYSRLRSKNAAAAAMSARLEGSRPWTKERCGTTWPSSTMSVWLATLPLARCAMRTTSPEMRLTRFWPSSKRHSRAKRE